MTAEVNMDLWQQFVISRLLQVDERRAKQRFEKHLCYGYQFPDDDNKDGCQNVGLLTVQTPEATARPIK